MRRKGRQLGHECVSEAPRETGDRALVRAIIFMALLGAAFALARRGARFPRWFDLIVIVVVLMRGGRAWRGADPRRWRMRARAAWAHPADHGLGEAMLTAALSNVVSAFGPMVRARERCAA